VINDGAKDSKLSTKERDSSRTRTRLGAPGKGGDGNGTCLGLPRILSEI